MPSPQHEALLYLFRNRPALAPELLREALCEVLPQYSEVRIESADFTNLQAAEYRADLVVLLSHGKPVLGIIVEVQLQPSKAKRFSWPLYVAGLRARFRCKVVLLVVTVSDRVARWASRPIDLGGGNHFVPLVLGPSGVPEITDRQRAINDPELAVLSAMAHGKDADTAKAAQIAATAMTASIGLDDERAKLYFDLVHASLSAAATEALQSMDPTKYEAQSEHARRWLAQGRAEGVAEGEARGEVRGEAKGRAALVLKLLILRFGQVPAAIEASIRASSIEQLENIAARALTARTLDEAVG